MRKSPDNEPSDEELEKWIDSDPNGIKLNPTDYLLTEIVEKIFCYLSVVNLCDASLVSREWYDLIANSVMCMKKIQLKCNFKLADEYIVPKNSIRKYEAISIIHNNAPMFVHAINLVTTSKKRWKSVKMNQTVFDTKDEFVDFLKAIAPSVENLLLQNITIQQSFDTNACCDVEFPMLKELEIKSCNTLINRSFGNVNRLTYLHINYGKDRTAATVVQKMLKSCNGLKNLSIGGDIFCEVFEELSNDIPFILTYLSVHCFENPPPHSMVKKNFNKFLIVHRSTLKCIHVDADLGKNVQDIIYYIMYVPDVTMLD